MRRSSYSIFSLSPSGYSPLIPDMNSEPLPDEKKHAYSGGNDPDDQRHEIPFGITPRPVEERCPDDRNRTDSGC